MNADAYAVVSPNGELVVARTTREAATKLRDAFYPGHTIKPLRLVADNDEAQPQVQAWLPPVPRTVTPPVPTKEHAT